MEIDVKNKVQSLRHQLSAMGRIECQPLFGGYSLSVDGVVFGMLVQGQLFLRVCGCQSYMAQHDPLLLRVPRRGKEIILNYWLVSDELLADSVELLRLASQALEAVYHEKQQQCQAEGAVRMESLLSVAGKSRQIRSC